MADPKLTRIAALRFLQSFKPSGADVILAPVGDLIIQPAGGEAIFRRSGGVAGTDETQFQWTGGSLNHFTIQNKDNGNIKLLNASGNGFDVQGASTTSITPTAAGAYDLGATNLEFRGLYLGEDASSGLYGGLDQNARQFYDEAGSDNWKLAGGAGAADYGDFEFEHTLTITGAVTDGYVSALRLDPGYTAATAQTVTRHNYIDIQDVSVAGAGPAAVTNACVLRFDAAAGTHKATVGATTKTTPGGVDAWLKVNINGTLYYVPAYTSTTA